MIVNTNKIIFCPFCFFFYFSATQTTPCGLGGGSPSPSGGVQSSGTLRSCPPSATNTGTPPSTKKSPGTLSGAVCVGFISTVSRLHRESRKETESSKRERTFLTPPHAKVKRFVSVVLVYCVAMSGCPFFNAAVSIRELVTVL